MHNYGMNFGDRNKGHRANGFTTDGGFAEYTVNNINTMVHVPDDMSDEEATLVVTAGTAMYGLDVMGGLIAGQTVVVMGPGPIGLMGVGVAKALGAQPVILTGHAITASISARSSVRIMSSTCARKMPLRQSSALHAARARTMCSSAQARQTLSTRPLAC